MASSSSGMSTSKHSPALSTASASLESPTDVPPTATPQKAPDESSKLRTLLSILRKFIGVSDIASVRFSLPAQLLEPTPNLGISSLSTRRRGSAYPSCEERGADTVAEYWNYLERPETFISIGDSEDALGRMLAVVRFWFTKDLKYVKGKPCKPYNSALGEFFRCNWDVEDTVPSLHGPAQKTSVSTSESTANKVVRVSFLTEQTSHHPPVSAFYIACPDKGISARGFDQLSAKFTGTSIRVTPGAHNLGIFINLDKRNEEYQLTHPVAQLSGLIRGSLSVTVADTCFMTCPVTRIKVILQYLEEGWLGKNQNRVNGAIYKYDPEKDHITRIKDVPEKDLLARIDGCWYDQIHYTLAGSKDPTLLVDLNPLFPVPKSVPPTTLQLPNESRRFWSSVTTAIQTKQFAQATKLKQELEERQRTKTVQREARGEVWKPRFFTEAVTPPGRPVLTEEGVAALKGLQKGEFQLAEREGEA